MKNHSVRSARTLGTLALLALSVGCGAAELEVEPAVVHEAVSSRSKVSFILPGLDGTALSSASLAGRMTVISFLATYDVPSQAEARVLANVLRRYSPRINVVGIVMEAESNRPLAEAFGSAMDLPYPLVFADADTLAGVGPFEGLHHVPSIVILDEEGREAFRKVGFVDAVELQAHLRRFATK